MLLLLSSSLFSEDMVNKLPISQLPKTGILYNEKKETPLPLKLQTPEPVRFSNKSTRHLFKQPQK